MPPALKRVAGFAGAALCVLAVVLLLRHGLKLGDALGERLRLIAPSVFAGALASYSAGAVLLGVAWAVLVRATAGPDARARPLFVAHLRSQLAKYLPGNVFHFAYRHVAARGEGAGHAALGGALALESALLVAAAALLALGVAADPRLAQLAPWARALVLAAPPAALAACVVAVWVVGRGDAAGMRRPRLARAVVLALAIDLAFFAAAAAALRLLCAQPQALPFAAWCGWLALAWIVGYVTPGAPGGLGLREAVLALALAPALGEAGAMAVALAYRLLTVVADAVLAAAGFLLGRRQERTA